MSPVSNGGSLPMIGAGGICGMHGLYSGWSCPTCSTGTPAPQRSCSLCGKPEHGSLACAIAPPWPVTTQPVAPLSDVLHDWRYKAGIEEGWRQATEALKKAAPQ